MNPLAAELARPKKADLEVFEIDPSELTLVKTKGHHLFDPRVLLPVDKSPGSLYALIKEFGFTHGALELERANVEGTDYLLVVDGKQRTLALLEINAERSKASLPPIKARAFVSGGGPVSQFVRMFVANKGRKDYTPMQEAQMLQNLVRLSMEAVPENDEPGRVKARQEAEHQGALLLGCSIDSVKNRMKLNDAAPEVKKALEKGTIAQSDALKIVGSGKSIRPVEEQVALLKATPEKTPGKRRTKSKKAAERAAAQKPGKRGGNKKPTVRQLQKTMDALGEGHDHYAPLAYAGGLLSAEAYFKKLKMPEPGARIVTKKSKKEK